MDQLESEHHKLLSIFHLVLAGIAAVFSFLPLLHLTFGILMVTGVMADKDPTGARMAKVMGMFFIGFSSVMILVGLAFSILVLLAGLYLRRRVHYTFCLVMAAVECMFMPFGTVLGVFTVIHLTKPSVKAAFPTITPEVVPEKA